METVKKIRERQNSGHAFNNTLMFSEVNGEELGSEGSESFEKMMEGFNDEQQPESDSVELSGKPSFDEKETGWF